jgi:nucleoside-diphosphate-sugar epimerase
MRVLVTGHDGYIGTVLVPLFQAAGHDVVGLDSFLFSECVFGDDVAPVPAIRKDLRDVTPHDLEGFDAVVNLAALSNDPLGDLNPQITYDINHHGAVIAAKAAKEAGVPRFLMSSSCSLYGAHGEAPIDESADFLPVTPYGESKVLSEQDISKLADDDFHPTFLRNATAYGYSPRLRGDLVVNNLVAYAMTIGEVRMKSDGTPWRPLVHIEDISRAFLAIAEAPLDLVHDHAFNVGRSTENYQIRDVARIVEETVPGAKVTFASGAEPDKRNYRVNCDHIAEVLPSFQPVWTVPLGVEQLYAAYTRFGLTEAQLHGGRLQRIAKIRELLESGKISDDLRWASVAA